MTGSSDWANQSSTKLLPIKPAPPVTRMLMLNKVPEIDDRRHYRYSISRRTDVVRPPRPIGHQPPDSSADEACLSWPSSAAICGSASCKAAFRVCGGLMTNMPLAGRPGRITAPASSDVSLLDLTLRVAFSQGLPALVARVLSLRGTSCASGRGMIGYQTA